MIELDDDAVQAIREGAIPGARFADDWHAIDDAARVMQIFFKAPPAPERPAEQPAETSVRTEVRRRRPRSVTLASALKKAEKAGKHVAGAVIEDGKVTLTFGEPGGAAVPTSNPWDAEIARLTQ
jgi:hypothetical protein